MIAVLKNRVKHLDCQLNVARDWSDGCMGGCKLRPPSGSKYPKVVTLGIFWLSFCTMAGSGNMSSIFINVSEAFCWMHSTVP